MAPECFRIYCRSRSSIHLKVMPEKEREEALDDECIKEFKAKTMNRDRVMYTENPVTNGEEILELIRNMNNINDLFIVGRGETTNSDLTAGLTDWTESPELGVIGDLLSSEDFTVTVSVLVIQQYKGIGLAATDNKQHFERGESET